jgi:hypothetical protein
MATSVASSSAPVSSPVRGARRRVHTGGWQAVPGASPVVPLSTWPRRWWDPSVTRKHTKSMRDRVARGLANALKAGVLPASTYDYAVGVLFSADGGAGDRWCTPVWASQRTKGEWVVLSERSVRAHERVLERLGFLRIWHRKPVWDDRTGGLKGQTNVVQFCLPEAFTPSSAGLGRPARGRTTAKGTRPVQADGRGASRPEAAPWRPPTPPAMPDPSLLAAGEVDAPDGVVPGHLAERLARVLGRGSRAGP